MDTNSLKLPYIILPKINLKFMIDTGAVKSLTDPKIADKYYDKCIHKELFKISFCHYTILPDSYYDTITKNI